MSTSGNGAGSGRPPHQAPVPVHLRPQLPEMVTPEQTCLGCGLGCLALLLALLFWGYVFWRIEQAEQVKPVPPPARRRVSPPSPPLPPAKWEDRERGAGGEGMRTNP